MKTMYKIKFVSGLFLFFLLTVFFYGCSNSGNDNNANEQIFVTVNGVHLTESDLLEIIPEEFYDKLTTEHKRKIIEEWVQTELLYQEALSAKIDKEPEIERLLLNSKQNLLSNEYLERELSDIEPPSTDELREYYEKNTEYFKVTSPEFVVRYALFDNKDDANAFYSQVKNNESFSELAQKLSKHPSSVNGGNLGLVNEETVEPNIWEMINNIYTKAGLTKISDVFMVIDGWGCVIVDEVYVPESIKPFEYVKDLLIDMYMSEKREEEKEALLRRLTATADIKYEIIR
ncbi:peptidyl-prolyl cis-trans isomerase [Candidatus Latescibacterota bacterium]